MSSTLALAAKEDHVSAGILVNGIVVGEVLGLRPFPKIGRLIRGGETRRRQEVWTGQRIVRLRERAKLRAYRLSCKRRRERRQHCLSTERWRLLERR